VSDSDRITGAVGLIHRYGGIDGDHHKQWVLDQVLRVLLGPEGYAEFARKFPLGPDGEEDHYSEWDRGTAP
jgi:hypothetical protein